MSHMVDEYEELAGLFLTEPDHPRGGGGGGLRTQTCVEIVAIGHLPVRAGLWLAPYADALARSAGPTALLRLDDHGPHLQVMRGAEECARALTEPTLEASIAAMARALSLWIIRPSPAAGPADIVAAGPDRVTILTAGDEAARVHAYTMIKEIIQAADDAHLRRPEMGLAIAGCDEDTARCVFQRLNQTTKSYLGVELALVLAMRRMDGGMISSGYRQFAGPFDDQEQTDLAQVVALIHDEAARAAASPRSAAATAGATAPPAAIPMPPPPAPVAEPPLARVEIAAAAPLPEAPPPLVETWAAPTAGPAHGQAAPTQGTSAEPWVARRAAPLRARPEVEVEPKAPVAPREPDSGGRPVPLSTHVEGLIMLPIRCPGHEAVEIAVDTSGRLNLLGPEDALRRMHVVRRWALDHREIIEMACPRHRIDARREPQIHLFTDRPLAVADLHASDVGLYVRAPVKVGQQIGWYVARLNASR